MKEIWITEYGMWGTGKFWGIEEADNVERVDVSQWSEVDWDMFEAAPSHSAIQVAKLINKGKA